MGCHTWFYKKVNYFSREKLISAIVTDLKVYAKALDTYIKLRTKGAMIPKDLSEILKDDQITYYLENLIFEVPIEDLKDAKFDLKVYQRYISWWEKGWISETTLIDRFKIPNELEKDESEIDETLLQWMEPYGLYEAVPDFHDEFRRKDYPKDLITSYKDTITYIKENYELIRFSTGTLDERSKFRQIKDCLTRLKQFWDKYPNGIIEFG